LTAVGSASAAGPLDEVSCSWVGNSFADKGVNKWVQQDIEGLFVASDGTVYAIVFWHEASGEATAYENGNVLTTARHTHGWNYRQLPSPPFHTTGKLCQIGIPGQTGRTLSDFVFRRVRHSVRRPPAPP
jgi:hypothetical protein